MKKQENEETREQKAKITKRQESEETRERRDKRRRSHLQAQSYFTKLSLIIFC
jgi:hypothetical protein